jgi:hypothetical protein
MQRAEPREQKSNFFGGDHGNPSISGSHEVLLQAVFVKDLSHYADTAKITIMLLTVDSSLHNASGWGGYYTRYLRKALSRMLRLVSCDAALSLIAALRSCRVAP